MLRRWEGHLLRKLSLAPENQSRSCTCSTSCRSQGYGADLMENALLPNCWCWSPPVQRRRGKSSEFRYHPVVEKIIAYINAHIGKESPCPCWRQHIFEPYICASSRRKRAPASTKYITARASASPSPPGYGAHRGRGLRTERLQRLHQLRHPLHPHGGHHPQAVRACKTQVGATEAGRERWRGRTFLKKVLPVAPSRKTSFWGRYRRRACAVRGKTDVRESFAMFFGGGKIFFLQLDGLGARKELVMENIYRDMETLLKPSMPSRWVCT